MNVLHLINYTGGGGTERYIYSLAEKLHSKDCNFFLGYSIEGDSLEEFKKLGISTFKLPMKNSYDLKAAKLLATFCKKNSINIIHTHFLRENYIAILSKLFGNKAKIINTRHMLIKNSKLVSLVNRFMTNFNSNIIAVSVAVKELLNKELPGKNIDLIYTGVDINSWSCNTSTIREELNIGKDQVLITNVARLSKEKGHEFLLRAIYQLKEKLKGEKVFKLLIVGDGILLEELSTLTHSLGLSEYVIFTGYREDINNILSGSDIFVSTSKSEAFGISILEAMASKLPVITTNSGGTKEIISINSKNGILINYGDYKSLVNNLENLILDKEIRKNYAINGFNHVSNNFSLDKTASETLKVYKK